MLNHHAMWRNWLLQSPSPGLDFRANLTATLLPLHWYPQPQNGTMSVSLESVWCLRSLTGQGLLVVECYFACLFSSLLSLTMLPFFFVSETTIRWGDYCWKREIPLPVSLWKMKSATSVSRKSFFSSHWWQGLHFFTRTSWCGIS